MEKFKGKLNMATTETQNPKLQKKKKNECFRNKIPEN